MTKNKAPHQITLTTAIFKQQQNTAGELDLKKKKKKEILTFSDLTLNSENELCLYVFYEHKLAAFDVTV